jgi:hemerythrin-like domain-containing protein
MTAPADLHLSERNGLPDEVAYLRAAFPKPQWQAHANYGELADFWLQVHSSLRAHGGQLQQLTHAFRDGSHGVDDFQRAFVPGINQFLQHLNAHHQIEDGAYFPKFRALDTRMVAGFDLLEADHHVIHEAIGASVDSARGLLAALAQDTDTQRRAADAYAAASDNLLDLLLRHLADEEDLVIPAMLEHGERSLA